jgi:hypothetical protein
MTSTSLSIFIIPAMTAGLTVGDPLQEGTFSVIIGFISPRRQICESAPSGGDRHLTHDVPRYTETRQIALIVFPCAKTQIFAIVSRPISQPGSHESRKSMWTSLSGVPIGRR